MEGCSVGSIDVVEVSFNKSCIFKLVDEDTFGIIELVEDPVEVVVVIDEVSLFIVSVLKAGVIIVDVGVSRAGTVLIMFSDFCFARRASLFCCFNLSSCICNFVFLGFLFFLTVGFV